MTHLCSLVSVNVFTGEEVLKVTVFRTTSNDFKFDPSWYGPCLIEMIGILSVLLLRTVNSAVLGLSKDILVCSAGSGGDSVRGSSSSRFGGSALVLGDYSCLIPSWEKAWEEKKMIINVTVHLTVETELINTLL